MKCEYCNLNEGTSHSCNGDGRLHGHGAVHSFLAYGIEHGLLYLCDQCYELDKKLWNEEWLITLRQRGKAYYDKRWQADSKEIAELQDKLHRRNMQIKDLKAKQEKEIQGFERSELRGNTVIMVFDSCANAENFLVNQ